MSATIQMEMAALNRRLEKMRQRAAQPGGMMAKISVLMHKDVMDHFKKTMGDKKKWDKLSPITISMRRKGSSKPLQDTGRLRASIRPSATRTKAVVGTNLVYARIHNEGGRSGRGKSVNIPQRKFMWLSKSARKLFTKMLGKFYIGE